MASDIGARPVPPRRILIVEDDVSIADMYSRVLRMRGHLVQVAHDGETGLVAARNDQFDLVFLDVRLPKMDGISVLAELARNTGTAAVPVVMLTNYDDPVMKSMAERIGARDYRIKSTTTPRQLADLVADWTAA